VPVFIGHGDADQQIPVALSGRLQARYCRLGVMVTRRVYPGVDHGAVIDAAIDTAMAFIADRYDHRPASTTCG
jgi:predicted esterase